MNQTSYEKRSAYALELHDRNFSCAQSVACACCDLVGLDEETAFKIMEGFGGGMGGFTETCGALSGAVALVGYASSSGPDNPITKADTYKQIAPLVERFRQMEGSTRCGELTGLAGGPRLQQCTKLIEDCVRLTVELLDGAPTS